MANMVNVNIRIDENLSKNMREMAKGLGLSFSAFVSLVLNKTKQEWKLELKLPKQKYWYDVPWFYEEIVAWDKPENYVSRTSEELRKDLNI